MAHSNLMVSILAACGVTVAATVAGCVDLAGSDTPAGPSGGKADEPACDTSAYATYLRGFYRAQSAQSQHNDTGTAALMAAATGNPCPASDAAYVVWLQFVNQLVITPVTTRVPPMPLDGIFAKAADYQRYAEAAAFTADELWLVATWNLTKPATAGKAGVNEWSKLYVPFVDRAKNPGLLATQIVEPFFALTAPEKSTLAAVASLRPTSTASLSYQIWYDNVFTGLPRYYRTETEADVVARLDAFVAEVATTRPAAATDIDQSAFLDRYVAQLKSDTALTTPRVTASDAIAITNPGGGGPLAAKTWLSAVNAKVSGLGTVTAGDQLFIDGLLEVKPCGDDPSLHAASTALGAALVTLGLTTDADATALVACE